MKKLLAMILSLAMTATLASCNHGFGTDLPLTVTHTTSDYPAALMVDGEVYLKSIETKDLGDIEPDGYTTAYTSEYPDEDGECNFNPGVGMPYVFDGPLYVFYEEAWYLCTLENPPPMPDGERGIVVSMDYGLLVAGERLGLCSVDIDGLADPWDIPETLSVGDRILIIWDGTVQESYPAGIVNVSGITSLEEGDDILGAYRAAFTYLQEADSGLDSDIEKIALDLQATSNHLTTAEKEALTYLIACDSGMFDSVYQSTFEDLLESGDIVDDGFASFENGVLYTFVQTDSSADGFTFDMEKFRSSLGAYGVEDCEVVFDDDGNFTLTTGVEWIS